MSDLIREGFICPECQKDLTCFELLQEHFELEHTKQIQQDDKSKALTSVLHKAKNLIRSPTDHSSSSLSSSHAQVILDNYQEIGVNRSFTSEFKNHRDNTIGRYVIQTNKLLTTLDKLQANNLSFKDEKQRKQYEQTIVQWVSDNDVKLCPTCARQFSLLHRKHHCRLCGAIMCNKCSQFLSNSLARLSNNRVEDFIILKCDLMVHLSEQNFFNLTPLNIKNNLNLKEQLTDSSLLIASLKDTELKFKRSTSQTSLNSSLNDGSNEHFYRICSNCICLLNKKYQSLKEKSNRPKLCELYDDFNACIKEAEKMYPVYTKMSESINAGETVYNYKTADDMRIKLIQTFQRIDLLSNTILSLKLEITNESSSSSSMSKLQRNIRLYAVNYLKEYSFQLASLPNEEQYEKLKEQKRLNLIEEMEQESKQKHEQQNSKTTNAQIKVKKNNFRHIDNSAGWISKQTSKGDEDDPIKIQIKLVQGYIDDAKAQHRLAEVEILEENLKELFKNIQS